MLHKKLNNENGQALFEMIIFLPFLIFLFTIFSTVGNSLSGSINQQKAVRGYFYRLVKGNSYVVPAPDLDLYVGSGGIKTIGFFAIGWNEKLMGKDSYANCFKFSSLLKNGTDEKCEDSARPEPETSSFIRVFTMYGVCGPVFHSVPPFPGGKKFVIDQKDQLVGTPEACSLQ